MLEVPGQGAGPQYPEVLLFFPNATSQPKTFPWALVPSSGSDAETREAFRSPSFLGRPWARIRSMQMGLNLFPTFDSVRQYKCTDQRETFTDV